MVKYKVSPDGIMNPSSRYPYEQEIGEVSRIRLDTVLSCQRCKKYLRISRVEIHANVNYNYQPIGSTFSPKHIPSEILIQLELECSSCKTTVDGIAKSFTIAKDHTILIKGVKQFSFKKGVSLKDLTTAEMKKLLNPSRRYP